jgi:hypothetical protein
MARPKNSTIPKKSGRLVVLVDRVEEAQYRAMAEARYRGNMSEMIRVALADLKVRFQADVIESYTADLDAKYKENIARHGV